MTTPQRRRRPGGRRFFPRRKVCQFCVDKVTISYKDVQRNRRFISEWGKIESRRKTGTCAPHQRQLSLAIKRARYLALLPYTGGHSLMELGRSDPRGDRARRPFRDAAPAAGPPTADAPDQTAAPDSAEPAAAVEPSTSSADGGTTAAEAPPAEAPAQEEPVAEAAESEAELEEAATGDTQPQS